MITRLPSRKSSPVEAPTPSRRVGRLVKLVFQSLLRNIDGRMQPLGLTALQWEPLILIHVGIADTVAALARESQVNCASMTRMLDRLETKELLRRRRSSVDRRVVHVDLTPRGRKVVGQIMPLAIDALDQHLQGFAPGDVSRLIQLLERMLENGTRNQVPEAKSHG